MKRACILLLVTALLSFSCLAETATGTVSACESIDVYADHSGKVTEIAFTAGELVAQGDTAVTLSGETLFSSCDGTVTSITTEAGNEVSGTLFSVSSFEIYRIVCNVKKAYDEPENKLIHAGETLYVKCTKDGSHLATGTVTNVSGSDYTVMTHAGELYIGETVYLYRDSDFETRDRVGIGTVVYADDVTIDASGTVSELFVSEGDIVEKGQKLATINGGDVTFPIAGILSQVYVSEGENVQEGQKIASIVPLSGIMISLTVDAASLPAMGEHVDIVMTYDRTEKVMSGTVERISILAQDADEYTVWIRPESTDMLRLGMTARVIY